MDKLPKTSYKNILGIFLALTLLLAGCNLPQSAPLATQPLAQVTEEEIEVPYIPPSVEETAIPVPVEGQEPVEAEVTSQVFLPQIEVSEGTAQAQVITEETPSAELATPEPPSTPQGPVTQLAFLSDGNLMLVDVPNGSPRQLTSENNLMSFAWSPDGNQIAVYNGNQLCFVQRAGSSARDCLDLNLDETQAKIRRQILWSPDQKSIVLWNSVNPWDEGAIGWMLVSLDASFDPLLILDPVDWGLEMTPDNEPGGITGQPVFLPDGSLIGTVTHRWMCGSGGCHYQLFQFNQADRSFSAYPNKPQEGFSEGQHLVLSKNSNTLVNFGTFMSGCEQYFTFVDFFQLDNQTRKIFNLEQEAIASLTLSPDNQFAVIARTAGCSDPNQVTWASGCGLSTGPDIYPMQVWDLSTNERSDLIPGTEPTWSSNGYWLAFSSCLTQNASGNWETNPQGFPEIVIRSFVDGITQIIGPGTQPGWRP